MYFYLIACFAAAFVLLTARREKQQRMAPVQRGSSLAYHGKIHFTRRHNKARTRRIAYYNTYPMSKLRRDIGSCQSPKAKPWTMEGDGDRVKEEKKMRMTSPTCDGRKVMTYKSRAVHLCQIKSPCQKAAMAKAIRLLLDTQNGF